MEGVVMGPRNTKYSGSLLTHTFLVGGTEVEGFCRDRVLIGRDGVGSDPSSSVYHPTSRHQ